MRNRETKLRKVELTSAQIMCVRNAINFMKEKHPARSMDAEVVAHVFNSVVEDVVITIVD